jgi:chromosome segregation ATPase
VANFASKNEIDKLNTRLDLFQTKLDKLTNIVPSNEDLLRKSDSNEGLDDNLGVNEAWSKHVLTKRIESNEESLDKFTQMIDELSSKLKNLQSDMSKKIKSVLESLEGASDSDLTDSMNEVLARLAEIESGTSKIDDLQKKLNSLSKSQKDLKDGSESRFQEFSLELKKLKGLIEGLESQFSAVASQMSGIQQSVAIAQQQAAHALASGGSDVPLPPAPVMNSGPDLETIRALAELKNKLNSLCDKVDVIENNENGKISQEDLELMKASLLEEIPNYIENSLENIRAQLAALADKNDKLNEIIDLKMKKDDTPTEKLTRPRSAASRSDLEKLASKAQVEKIQKTLEKSTSRLDDRISSEIMSLHEKIKGSSGGMWDDLEKLKNQFSSFTEDLGNLRTNMIQKMSELEGMSGGGQGEVNGNNSLLSVDTLSPALTKLIDRLQKKQWNLEESMAEITGTLANLDEEGRNRSENIRVLFASVEKLEKTKADKSEIVELQETKADKSEIKQKVSRDDFDSAMSDMSDQLSGVISQMLEVEQNWKSSLDQTNDRLKNSMNSSEMNEFKSSLEGRLKNLKVLLERSQKMESSYEHGDCTDTAAVFRKPLMGYKCVSCDKVTYPMPGAPVASIPMSGNLPHMRTIRPFTTFDLHTIRNQSKITKTGYEERMMLKMKQNIDKKYRQHVAESLNSAFNVHEQQKSIDNTTVPIGGGSSIPKGYQISKTGRSCGGGHTLTNPHIRFAHLKNLGEMWDEVDEISDVNDSNTTTITTSKQTSSESKSSDTKNSSEKNRSEQPIDNIKEKVAESCNETQLTGNDGHIYRGRQQDD